MIIEQDRACLISFDIHLIWLHVQVPIRINPSAAKLFDWNFHPLEVVSRWRDPQLQVGENYFIWQKILFFKLTIFKSCWLMSRFILNMFERPWYLMCW